jgi:hypothetical protein
MAKRKARKLADAADAVAAADEQSGVEPTKKQKQRKQQVEGETAAEPVDESSVAWPCNRCNTWHDMVAFHSPCCSQGAAYAMNLNPW